MHFLTGGVANQTETTIPTLRNARKAERGGSNSQRNKKENDYSDITIVLVLNAQSTEPAFSPDLKSVSRREPMGIDTSVVRHKYSSRVSLFRGDARN